ncbi:MAG TPA: hypothetical protein VEI07_02090 [Planctomycetaceae bacterium]|nr:hypothetical protein [Planctomycetaceae bacterium]
MGTTIWVDVEGRPEDDVPPDHSIMFQLMDELDELSDRLKVAKLSEFCDYSVMAGEFAEELAGLELPLEDENNPSGRWFDPGRPLEAVRAIHDRLSADFTALSWVPDRSRDHWPTVLMEELQHCRTVLEEAQARGQKCRLLIVP